LAVVDAGADERFERGEVGVHLLGDGCEQRWSGAGWLARAGNRRRARAGIAVVGDGAVFVSVDIGVLDPAFAPGTGTPEPGGMTSGDLLWACRTVGQDSA
jgi:hypothetical protein